LFRDIGGNQDVLIDHTYEVPVRIVNTDLNEKVIDMFGAGRPRYRLGSKCFQTCREMYDLFLGPFEQQLCGLKKGTEILLVSHGMVSSGSYT
jgi:hypothetical protein